MRVINAAGAPSFRVRWERVGDRDLVFLFPGFQSLTMRDRCSHPCKERKDGAPSVVVMRRKIMGGAGDETVASSGSDRVLVIMAKAPRPGAVKTRLAPSLSPEAVSGFYCCLLNDTLALARSVRDVEVAIMCPESDVNELARLSNTEASSSDVTVVAQTGEGLAAGLTSVFAHFAADYQSEDRQRPDRQRESHQRDAHQRRIIAFNSDSPHLPRPVLEEAFETLAAQDVVVGPTHDGGYYLVGAKASHPTLFAGDGMGTSSALERLLARAQDLQLSVGFADRFYDIDVADDLSRLAQELRLCPARAPRTAEWLREWGLATAKSRMAVGEL